MEIVSMIAAVVAAIAASYALVRSFRTDRDSDAVAAVKASDDFSRWIAQQISNAQARLILDLIEKRTFVETKVFEQMVDRLNDIAKLVPAIERLNRALDDLINQ